MTEAKPAVNDQDRARVGGARMHLTLGHVLAGLILASLAVWAGLFFAAKLVLAALGF